MSPLTRLFRPGSSPTPYRDSAGLPTIGIGHLCQRSDCSEIPYPIPMTQANIINLLNSDLLVSLLPKTTWFIADPGSQIARQGITSQVKVTLNASQYGALVSWAFNVGTGDAGSKGSTLVRRLNAGEDKNRVAAEELPKWNKAGGSVSNGLVRRRAAEVKLFQTATSERGIPAPC